MKTLHYIYRIFKLKIGGTFEFDIGILLGLDALCFFKPCPIYLLYIREH